MSKVQKNKNQESNETARILFEKGSEAWKEGKISEAMTYYSRSAQIDPEGPGAKALEMSKNIMNFYDKNQFNP